LDSEEPSSEAMNFDLVPFAKNLGWQLAGVTAPNLSDETKTRTQIWLKDFKGPQMNYLTRRSSERLDPRVYFPPVRSILTFGLFYFRGWASGSAKVSNYAWPEDYHDTLAQKLERTAHQLQTKVGEFQYRVCVDTAPVLEKSLATQSGIGWQGKNTLVLNPNYGSLFFLGELFTTLPLHLFQATLPMSDHCGRCQRCIDACPTEALTPYVLDASKCISYWTLEHKGAFTSETPPLHNWVAGCDICQEVCPWNQKLIPLSAEPSPLQALTAEDIRSEHFSEKIKNSAASYVPRDNWLRNLEASTPRTNDL
jgi:epoxyqueuosine reductase